jgi:hypothetical protein
MLDEFTIIDSTSISLVMAFDIFSRRNLLFLRRLCSFGPDISMELTGR